MAAIEITKRVSPHSSFSERAHRNQNKLDAHGYVERVAKVVGVYRTYGIDARVGGSLGKAISLGKEPSSHNDIDIIVVGPQSSTEIRRATLRAKQVARPLEVDEHLRGVLARTSDGKAHIRKGGVDLEIDPRTIQTYVGTIFGIQLPTFPPDTNFHILALYGHLRPKDFSNLLRFGRALREQQTRLDESLYKPFHYLYSLRKKAHPNLEKVNGFLAWYYNKYTPDSLRGIFHPLTQKLWYLSMRFL